eukprot:2154238-Rhodomonas_salina.1
MIGVVVFLAGSKIRWSVSGMVQQLHAIMMEIWNCGCFACLAAGLAAGSCTLLGKTDSLNRCGARGFVFDGQARREILVVVSTAQDPASVPDIASQCLAGRRGSTQADSAGCQRVASSVPRSPHSIPGSRATCVSSQQDTAD